ncbi:uncharacterized protein LOC144128132 isoform X2 [Amblyomma americanum]
MDTQSLSEEVGTILRSILTSEKLGIPLRLLDGEYRTLTGSHIPYQKLGFNTLEAYLRSVPDVAKLNRNAAGDIVVIAVVSESTAHVAQMVRDQKSTRSKPVVRKTYRRPISQQHVGYRPNNLLTTLTRNANKPAPNTLPGERSRAGYEVYRVPAQRGAVTSHAKQSNNTGSHKQEPSAGQTPGSSSRNPAYSALAPEQGHRSRYRAPRFQRAKAPHRINSSTGRHEEIKSKTASCTAEQPSVSDSPKPSSGWGELNNSWVGPRMTTVKTAAQYWECDDVGGDAGDSRLSTTGPSAAAAQSGSEEPAQPVATVMAAKSLGSTRASEPPAVLPAPVATQLSPVITSRPSERRPSVELDQDRFNPFRQPLQLDLIPSSSVLEETDSTYPKPMVPTSVTPVTPTPVSKELGISLRSTSPKTAATSKELGILLQSHTDAARAPANCTSQLVHVSATVPTLVAATSIPKELGISLHSSTASSRPNVFPYWPIHVSATAPVNQSTLMPSPSGPVRKLPISGDMLQPRRQNSAGEPDPPTPNCQLVLEYARREGLQHLYSTMQHRSQRKEVPLVWLAVLRLGDHKFVSYPEEAATPEEAKEIAAERAVTALRLHPQAAAHVLPVTPASSPEEVATLVKKIASLVIGKPKGILKEGVGPLYEQTFEEQLPAGWFEHVTNSGLINIERGHHLILYPLDCADQTSPAQNGHDPLSDHSSSASNSTGEPGMVTDYVDVFVTCVTSTNNVCFRFINYDAEYSQLLEDMAAFYNGPAGSAASRGTVQALPDELYATLHDGRWLRVQVVALHDEGQKVECFFVDEGNTSLLPPAALVELDDAFAAVPLQAIRCQLDGLAEYAKCGDVADILSDVLLGKTLVAEIVNREEPVSVIMFDTWGPEDVDLNNVVFQRLMGPKLPKKGCVGCCYVSHIQGDGLIWVQISGPGLTVLNKFMHAVNDFCKNNNETVDKPVFGKIYASQYRVDNEFYRAALTSPNPLPSGEFRLRFVDFGNEDQAYLSELRSLDNLGEFVVRLPYQAVQCRLRNLTPADGFCWSDKASTAFMNIIGSGNPELLIKVTVPPTDSEPAVVELFKRHPETRHLVCVNSELALAAPF